MTTPEEQADLDVMKAAIVKAKCDAIDLQIEFSRMDATTLGHCGHKTLDSALRSALDDAKRKIKKLTDAHTRKWPD